MVNSHQSFNGKFSSKICCCTHAESWMGGLEQLVSSAVLRGAGNAAMTVSLIARGGRRLTTSMTAIRCH